MRQRSTSPIFFARHSPASTKAQDISRLLDPAYSSAAFATNSAYVDRHGELHDPDYRHFPVAKPKRRTSIPHRPRWESFDEDSDDEPEDDHFSPRRSSFSSYHNKRPVYSYSYVPTIVVPHSYDSQDTIIDDVDDDLPRQSGVSRIISRTRELTRNCKRRSLDAASDSPDYTPTLLTPDTPTTATPDTVVDDDDAASLHAPSHHHPLSHTLSHHSYHSLATTPIRRRRRYSDMDVDLHIDAPTEQRTEYVPTQEAEREQAWTPTCAQALRRQWQAVSLRIRFSVFRAQRRMKSRLARL